VKRILTLLLTVTILSFIGVAGTPLGQAQDTEKWQEEILERLTQAVTKAKQVAKDPSHYAGKNKYEPYRAKQNKHYQDKKSIAAAKELVAVLGETLKPDSPEFNPDWIKTILTKAAEGFGSLGEPATPVVMDYCLSLSKKEATAGLLKEFKKQFRGVFTQIGPRGLPHLVNYLHNSNKEIENLTKAVFKESLKTHNNKLSSKDKLDTKEFSLIQRLEKTRVFYQTNDVIAVLKIALNKEVADSVRMEALFTLGIFDETFLIEPLLNILDSKNSSAKVKDECIATMVNIGGAEELDYSIHSSVAVFQAKAGGYIKARKKELEKKALLAELKDEFTDPSLLLYQLSADLKKEKEKIQSSLKFLKENALTEKSAELIFALSKIANGKKIPKDLKTAAAEALKKQLGTNWKNYTESWKKFINIKFD